jgi:hypothetical protein
MKLFKAYMKCFTMGIILWMLSPFLVYGQLIEPVRFEINNHDLPEEVSSGELFYVRINAMIEDSWYLYSILNDPDDGPIPTMFSSEGEELFISGDIIESEAEIKFDPNFDAELGLHSGTADFQVPVRFQINQSGEKELKLNVHFQACDDVSCLPPQTVRLTTGITVLKDSGQEDYIADRSDFGQGTMAFGHKTQDSGIASGRTGVYILLVTILLMAIFAGALIHYRKKR